MWYDQRLGHGHLWSGKLRVNCAMADGTLEDAGVKQGIAILEIMGLGPALVALDIVEKAAPVEIVQYELNDFYGVCASLGLAIRPGGGC